MPRFRKRPVVIEAVQWWPGDQVDGVESRVVCGTDGALDGEEYGVIQTLEGRMRVHPGDWVITGVKGEKYPCKPDIFAATYEPADPAEADAGAAQDTPP